MNAVVIAILVMVVLSLSRLSVVFALVVSAMLGGLVAGLGLPQTVQAFNTGLGNGAEIALAYAVLGAFAVALSKSGLPDVLAVKLIKLIGGNVNLRQTFRIKMLLMSILLLAAISSQNIIPVHIAFIPVLIPPLLKVSNALNLDRRALACILTFGLVATYTLIPVGFGAIFLEQILMGNINQAGAPFGLHIEPWMMPMAMAIPVLGMAVGALFAVLVSYRKPRHYQDLDINSQTRIAHSIDTQPPTQQDLNPTLSKKTLLMASLAVILALITQLYAGSMILGGLVGFAVLCGAGIFRWTQADDVFTQGMRMMALVGFIMIAASGFAAVMSATGEVQHLVQSAVDVMGDYRGLAAFLMLLIGLVVTLGIGSSFSTVPILAVIYVPLCVQFGFSPLATVALIGTAAALGDAGSPASDSTLGPTSGLAADGQHDHIWDTVVPTFIHFNIPLLLFGWIAAMTL